MMIQSPLVVHLFLLMVRYHIIEENKYLNLLMQQPLKN